MFGAEIRKISEFLSENFQFLEVKFSIYLNRRVFVLRPNQRSHISFQKVRVRLFLLSPCFIELLKLNANTVDPD